MRSRARRVDPMIGRLTGAVVAVLLGMSTLAPVAASSADAAAVHAATAGSGVTLSIAADSMGVLQPGHDLGATATVTNGGPTVVAAGTISLWIDDAAVTSRSSLTSWLGSNTTDADATVIGTTATNRLEPGTTATVSITVPAASVGLGAFTSTTVLGIGASLSSAGSQVAVDHGSLLWYPGGESKTTNVAVAMPITTPANATGLISPEDLASYTGVNGLLTRQLDGLIGHPTVAIGLDPMILASIRVLGSSAPASAMQWRQRLLELPNDVFPLRYGDADAAGEVQSGLTTLLTPTTLNWALNAANFSSSPDSVGETPQPTTTDSAGITKRTPTPSATPTSGPQLPTLSELVAWPYTMSGIVWPEDDTVKSSDLPVFAANGLTTTILSGTNTSSGDIKVTPNAAMNVNGHAAIAADTAISTALRQAITATSEALWQRAMADLNAQLELIGQENGPGTRTILATLDRVWPSDSVKLGRTLSALESEPWAASVTLPVALATAPTPGVSIKDSPEPASRIARIQRLTAAEKSIDAFSTVLDDPTTMTGPARVGLLGLLGVAWVNSRNDWPVAADANLTATTKTLQSIRIVPASNVNVASTEAPIPITVENSLEQRVNIVLSASPSNGRLEIDGNATKTLQADSRSSVIVPVKATLGNGNVTLTLSLSSPTGVPIGVSATLPVEVHADWEGVGALVIAILLILLFGFGIVRNILRHRNERRATDATTAVSPVPEPVEGPEEGEDPPGPPPTTEPPRG